MKVDRGLYGFIGVCGFRAPGVQGSGVYRGLELTSVGELVGGF